MPDIVDLTDKGFATVQRDGNKIMDDTFIFGIFNKIAKKVNPFEEYMEYIFEHKKNIPIGSFKNEVKVKPWELLRCDMMFPTRRDIIQSNPITFEVGVHVAIIFSRKVAGQEQGHHKVM